MLTTRIFKWVTAVLTSGVRFSNSARLLGRYTSGSGDGEEVQLGTGLSIDSGVLNVTFPTPPVVDNATVNAAIAANAAATRTALELGDTATKTTSSGGNGAADSGKVPVFDARGGLTMGINAEDAGYAALTLTASGAFDKAINCPTVAGQYGQVLSYQATGASAGGIIGTHTGSGGYFFNWSGPGGTIALTPAGSWTLGSTIRNNLKTALALTSSDVGLGATATLPYSWVFSGVVARVSAGGGGQMDVQSGATFRTFSGSTIILDNASTWRTSMGLGNVDNTSDADKPVSTATQTALDGKADKTASINTHTGTTYTLVEGDDGKVIVCTNASGCAVTVPASLGAGFNCAIISTANDSTVTGASGVSINGVTTGSGTISAGYSAASLLAIAADSFAVSGNIGTVA